MVLKNHTKNAKQQAKKVARVKLILCSAFFSVQAFAFDGSNPAPPNPNPAVWSDPEVSSYTGKPYTNIRIHKKGSENTFVQFADLSGGATVKMLQYKANNKTVPEFWLNSIDYWWDKLGDNVSPRVSVVNGQFFKFDLNFHPTQLWNLVTDPNPLMLPVKSDGKVVTNGHPMVLRNDRTFLQQMNIGKKHAWVSPVNIAVTSAPNAIVGYKLAGTPQYNEPNGRTALCSINHRVLYGKKVNALMLYVASYKTADQMRDDMKQWGCRESDIVVLDGGGSTKFISKGGQRIGGDFRRVPQAIGFMN